MLFPIGDENVKGGYRPVFSYSFIAINIIVFFLQTMDSSGYLYIDVFGAVPAELTAGENLHTILTSMFMHGSVMHLGGNMLFLWVFADNIEATVGSTKFLVFYLLGGMGAVLGHVVLEPGSYVPMVGASGAISACLGGYLVMFPKSKIKMLFLITFSRFRINAYWFLFFWIGQELISGIGTINKVSGGGVAHWAHIGGFVVGVLGGFLFRRGALQVQKELPEQPPVWRRFDH